MDEHSEESYRSIDAFQWGTIEGKIVSDPPISEGVRAAIRASCRTQAGISAAAGVSPGQLSRFLGGERMVSVETLDKIARVLDLMVQVPVTYIPVPEGGHGLPVGPTFEPEVEENLRRTRINHGHSDSPISGGIRNAIEESELTPYRIARLSGVSAAQLSRFSGGKRGLSVVSLDKIAAILGVKILFRRYYRPSSPNTVYGVSFGKYGGYRPKRGPDALDGH